MNLTDYLFGYQVIQVEPGFKIEDPVTGEMREVTETAAVMSRNKAYMTEKQIAALKEHCEQAS